MLSKDIYSKATELLDGLEELLVESEMQRRNLKAPTKALQTEVTGMVEPIRLLVESSMTVFHKKYAKYIGNERVETPEETIARVVKETELKTKGEL